MTKLAKKKKGFETLSCLFLARDRVNVVGTNNDKVFQTTPRHSHSAHIHNLFHILLLAKSQQFPTFSPFMTVKRPVFGSCCFQNTYSTFFVFKKSDSVFSFSLETKNNWLNVFFFSHWQCSHLSVQWTQLQNLSHSGSFLNKTQLPALWILCVWEIHSEKYTQKKNRHLCWLDREESSRRRCCCIEWIIKG